MLKCQNLSFNYPGSNNGVRGVNIDIHQGERIGLVGRNGAGKTTLLKLFLGILFPTEGDVELFDHSTLDAPALQAGRQNTGVLLSEDFYPPDLTGLECLRLISILRSGDQTAWTAKEVLMRELGLEDHLKQEFKTMSTGNKRKLQLLGSMVSDPELLIWDEPANGLDIESIERLFDVIQSLDSSNLTLIFSTHIFEHIDRSCNRLLVVENGRLLHDQRLSDADESRLIYLGLAEQ